MSSRARDQIVIKPPGRRGRLRLEELWRYRSIILVLTRRDLMVRYRQTVVGVAWVLLQPLALMIVFSFFFGKISNAEFSGVPFPVFFITALAIWLPTIKVVNEGTISIVANKELVTRVYVPRVFMPLGVAIGTLVDLLFNLIAMELILLWYGFTPTLMYLLVPVLVAIGYTATLGVTLWLAAVNTAYRDVAVMLPFLTQLWFFVSPVLYPAEAVPEEFQPLYYLNPMALVLTGARWALTGSPAPPGYAWLIGSVVSVVLLIGGYAFFRSREPTFADVL